MVNSIKTEPLKRLAIFVTNEYSVQKHLIWCFKVAWCDNKKIYWWHYLVSHIWHSEGQLMNNIHNRVLYNAQSVPTHFLTKCLTIIKSVLLWVDCFFLELHAATVHVCYKSCRLDESHFWKHFRKFSFCFQLQSLCIDWKCPESVVIGVQCVQCVQCGQSSIGHFRYITSEGGSRNFNFLKSFQIQTLTCHELWS